MPMAGGFFCGRRAALLYAGVGGSARSTENSPPFPVGKKQMARVLSLRFMDHFAAVVRNASIYKARLHGMPWSLALPKGTGVPPAELVKSPQANHSS